LFIYIHKKIQLYAEIINIYWWKEEIKIHSKEIILFCGCKLYQEHAIFYSNYPNLYEFNKHNDNDICCHDNHYVHAKE